MNKSKLLQKLAVAGIAGAAVLAAPIKADAATFIIDDFNTSTTYPVEDTTGDGQAGIQGTGETAPATPITPGNIVWNIDGNSSVTREVYAEADFPFGPADGVSTEVCANCQTGHMVTDANTIGNSSWIYSGGDPVDGSQFTNFMMKYEADVAGGVVELFLNSTKVFMSAVLPSGITNINAPISFPGTFTGARINVLNTNDPEDIGSGNPVEIDADIDNAKLTMSTPEPGTILGLLAVTGLGLGMKRKQQK